MLAKFGTIFVAISTLSLSLLLTQWIALYHSLDNLLNSDKIELTALFQNKETNLNRL